MNSPPIALHVSPAAPNRISHSLGGILALRALGFHIVTLSGDGAAASPMQDSTVALARFAHFDHEFGPDSSDAGAYVDWLQSRVFHHKSPILLSPGPHDGDINNERLAECVAKVVRAVDGLRWWIYPVGIDLSLPSLYIPISDRRMGEMIDLLERGISERETFSDAVVKMRARAALARIDGLSRIVKPVPSGLRDNHFGELYSQVAFADGQWIQGRPRVLNRQNVSSPISGPLLNFYIERMSDLRSLRWESEHLPRGNRSV